MAAKTPSTTKRYKLGELSMVVATFTDLDDTDTWASGITTGYLGHFIGATSNPGTQASAGIHVAYSAGTFTFYPGEDNATGILYILVRG